MTKHLSLMLAGMIVIGAGCVSSPPSVSEPSLESQQELVVYETLLAERIGRLQRQSSGVSDVVVGKNGKEVIFTLDEDQNVTAVFSYSLDTDPTVYFQETAPLVSANTRFTHLIKEKQLMVAFRPTDPNKIARDANYLMEALWGQGFFDE